MHGTASTPRAVFLRLPADTDFAAASGGPGSASSTGSTGAPAASAVPDPALSPSRRTPSIQFRYGRRDHAPPVVAPAAAAAPVAQASGTATPTTPVAPAAPPAPTAPSAASAEEDAAAGGAYIDIPVTQIRKVIATNLTRSKAEIPHSYTKMDCRMDALMAMRKTLKEDAGMSVSVNDIIVKAAALALRDVPEVNSRLDGDMRVVDNETVDVSVAVATDNGLFPVIVKDADKMGLKAINGAVRELAGKAREGKIKPEEFIGGTFTISNLGMFGIAEFTAVINPPQSCIMAVGGSVFRSVGAEDGDTATITPAAAHVMTVCLSSDRRVVDEFASARFLDAFRSYIETPAKLYG